MPTIVGTTLCAVPILSTNVCQRPLAKNKWDAVTDSSRAPITAASQAGPVLGTGGPRSEGTRRAILGAARATFAARGYEQTTIRAVAAQAGVDASMVMRYFRSKAGLFTAAVTMDLQVPDLRSVPASGGASCWCASSSAAGRIRSTTTR